MYTPNVKNDVIQAERGNERFHCVCSAPTAAVDLSSFRSRCQQKAVSHEDRRGTQTHASARGNDSPHLLHTPPYQHFLHQAHRGRSWGLPTAEFFLFFPCFDCSTHAVPTSVFAEHAVSRCCLARSILNSELPSGSRWGFSKSRSKLVDGEHTSSCRKV